MNADTRIGFERTLEQDVAFGIRQQIDIVSKALSAAINDPYTAVQSIDHLSAVCCDLAVRPLGAEILTDPARWPGSGHRPGQHLRRIPHVHLWPDRPLRRPRLHGDDVAAAPDPPMRRSRTTRAGSPAHPRGGRADRPRRRRAGDAASGGSGERARGGRRHPPQDRRATSRVGLSITKALTSPGGPDPARRAAAADAAAGPGVRRRGRLCRSGKRGHEHRSRCVVRLPAALGAGRGHVDGRPGPVPLGQGRLADRPIPARAGGRPHRTLAENRLLDPGRAGGRRDRPGRDRRWGGRVEPAVRPADAGGCVDHHGGLHRAALSSGPAQPADVRAGDHRDVGRGHVRLPGRLVVLTTRSGRCRGRLAAATGRDAECAAGRRHARRHRDAPRHLPAFGADPGPPRCGRFRLRPSRCSKRSSST